MMNRVTLALLVLGLSAAASYAQRQPAPSNDLSIEYLLAVGKATGACGILDLQLDFQTNTKMPGANEFVVRFWTTEAARLGMKLEEYLSKHCQQTLSAYGRLVDLASQVDRTK